MGDSAGFTRVTVNDQWDVETQTNDVLEFRCSVELVEVGGPVDKNHRIDSVSVLSTLTALAVSSIGDQSP